MRTQDPAYAALSNWNETQFADSSFVVDFARDRGHHKLNYIICFQLEVTGQSFKENGSVCVCIRIYI